MRDQRERLSGMNPELVELIHRARHEAAAACRHTTPPAAPCDDCQRIADRFEDVLIAWLAEQESD